MALKTLIVIHRLLREGDSTFKEEFLNFSQRGRILQLSNFKDDSSPIGKIDSLILLINLIFFRMFCLVLVNGFSLVFIDFSCWFNFKIKFFHTSNSDLFPSSLGLLCLGTHICIVFGREAWMFSGVEVWYWSWTSSQACPRAGEGI